MNPFLRFAGLSFLMLLGVAASRAQRAPAVDPAAAKLGFDPVRLQRLDAVIQDHVSREQIAGGVMFIAREGQTAHLRTFGKMDREGGKPMAVDAIFRIASMSKAVTSVAVMMLYEEGKFMLHDPVDRYLPAFRGSVVAVPPPPGAPAGTKYATEKARRPIQIRDLLTHTAGLTYGDGLAVDAYKEARIHGWYFADKDETLETVIDRLGKLPLHAHPGETYQYGFSTDVLGRLVEVASGLPLDRFFAERIFAPLKMVDSCFFLPPEKEGRLAKVYGLEKGQLVLGDQGDYVRGPRKCFSGGAGLLSTTRDYARLLQMLLNQGELEGVRLLSRKSVELMQANHTGDKYRRDTPAFGLGFWVNTDLGYFGELGSEGAYGWGSAYFPQYLIDPKERIIALFMTQHRPSGGLDLNQKFKVLMYQALK
ncbi:MAG: beta-lactamase family protein [Verrucomicrobia bacterium]|nr:beta-lactamase family protein [Verrucomicrobiota bacterium]